jgi:uncharacterized protein YcaQ
VYAVRPTAQAAPTAAPAAAEPLDAGAIAARMDALVDLIVQKYAPLPGGTLVHLVGRLRGGAPQWAEQRTSALSRAKQRLGHERVEGVEWYWPAGERPTSVRWRPDEAVRLLTPFDPIVWDRRRFELFWGWSYRFEAYTPAPKRKLGYYALPLLWHDEVIGWGNANAAPGGLRCSFGYAKGRAPRSAAFRAACDQELARMQLFLGQTAADVGGDGVGAQP